jgi:oxygen-independent coproporphyrinogen-3 oxidase
MQNINTLKSLKCAGFTNINIDLIYRIPGQSIDQLLSSIQTAIDMQINHISLYPLWVRPGTSFFEKITKSRLSLPDEASERSMLQAGRQLLHKNGYYQYNVFDFVDRPENRCINTLHQWEDGEWIGVGPGSTSYFEGNFYINTYDIDKYMAHIENGISTPVLGRKLSTRDKIERTMIFGLRMFPFSRQRFYNQYGVDVESVFGKEIDFLKEHKMIEMDDQYINLTLEGIINVNGISKLFYAKASKKSLQPLGIDKSGNIILEDDL